MMVGKKILYNKDKKQIEGVVLDSILYHISHSDPCETAYVVMRISGESFVDIVDPTSIIKIIE